MAKNHLKHLGVALGFEDDDSVVAGAEGEGLNGSETVEGEMLEAADADAEVTEVNTDVEQTEETIENLEDIAVAMESAAANGGLSREAAVFANLALKAAVGPKAARVIMPAMPSFESYSGGSASRRATTLSVEIVGESLRKFWAALVAKIKQLWNKLRGWWKKMTDAAPKIKARAEALAKKSADVTGQAEERTIELGLALQLHIDGRTPQPATALEQVKKLVKGCDEFLGNESKGSMEKISNDFAKTAQDVVDKDTYKNLGTAKSLGEIYKTQGATFKAITQELVKSSTSNTSKVKAFGEGSANDLTKRFGDDADHTISIQLLGGRAIVASRPGAKLKDENSGDFSFAKMVRASGLRFTDFLAKPKEVDSSGEFKTMSSSDVRSICDGISDMMDNIIEYNKTWQAREKMQAEIEKQGNAAIRSAEQDSGSEDNTDASGNTTENLGIRSKVIKDVVGSAMAFLRIGATFESSYINYCTKTSQALLQWAERSLAQYK